MTSAHRTNGSGDGLPPVASIPLTDDDPARSAAGESIGALVRDATTHLSTLIRAEVELARSEITAEVKQGLRGSIYFVIALTMVVLLMPFFLTAAALAISMGLPHWAAPWGGFAIVFLAMAALAVLFAILGWRRVRRLRGPRRTLSSVRDTAAALTQRHGEPDQPRDR